MGLRKPLAILEMNGALKRNPGRHADRVHEIECPDSIGDAPEHLSEPQKAVWAELVSNVPEGVLRSPDRFLVELVCKLMARSRDPEVIMQTSEIALLVTSLGKLGLNPIDRSKVRVEPKKEAKTDDPWSKL